MLEKNKHGLDLEVKEALIHHLALIKKQHKPDCRSIFTFVERSLNQLDLSSSLKYDVFAEAYLQGVKRIIEGSYQMNEPKALMKEISFQVINNWKEKTNTFGSIRGFDEIMSETEVHINTKVLILAFQQLNPRDRQILEWLKIQGLSWSQVNQRLTQAGDRFQREETLIKWSNLALTHLRQAYLNCRKYLGEEV